MVAPYTHSSAYDQDGIEGKIIVLPKYARSFSWYGWKPLPLHGTRVEEEEFFPTTTVEHRINVPEGWVVVECCLGRKRWYESMPEGEVDRRFRYVLEDGEFRERA